MKQLASLAEALDDIEIRIAELLAKSRTSSSPSHQVKDLELT